MAFQVRVNQRRGSQALYSVPTLAVAANRIIDAYAKHQMAVAVDEVGQEVGAAWKLDGHWAWYCES